MPHTAPLRSTSDEQLVDGRVLVVGGQNLSRHLPKLMM